MEARTFILIDQANRCGKFDCLKGCCDSTVFREIWILMRNISEADLPDVHQMLCGCAVQPSSPKALPGQTTVPGTNIPATGTCADALTAWACESSHVAVLSGIDTALTAAAVYAKASVPIATILAALSIFVSDMIASCRDDEPSWTSTFIAKACGLNDFIDKALGKGQEVGPILSVLQTIKDTLTLSGVLASKCCTNLPAGVVWPDLGSTTTTYITPPAATNNQGYK